MTTEAGRRLLALTEHFGPALPEMVAAIEAEARAALLAELEAGVEGLAGRYEGDHPLHVRTAAVLDLIRKAGEPVEVTLYETSVVKDPPHPSWTVHRDPRAAGMGGDEMTDTRARDALAAALGEHGAHHPDPEDDYGYDPCSPECAPAILTHPFTPDQRRALAAAFLDAETLAEALDEAGRDEPFCNGCGAVISYHADCDEQDGTVGWPEPDVAAILAALRETP